MHEQIAANKRKSVLLVVGAFVFFGAVGALLGYVFGTGVTGLVIALVIATVLSISSYLYGDRLVLASSRAREVSAQDEPRLHNLVEGLAIAAGVPKPRIHVVPEQAPNAFATGRDPEHASIAVTDGLLATMDRVELEGVIGHELAHVLDRDMLLGTIVATLVGAVVLMSEFLMRSWFWGGLGGRRGNDNRGGPATLILFGVGFALMVLAPVAGEIIKRAVSRNREFLADAQGAMLTRYPPGLASALRKIGASSSAMHSANNATGHLWLSQPSRIEGQKLGPMEKIFATHPPIAERIRRLEEM
ncbi:MAG TPA: M48 family metalloprotease [Actinomycetota bacterium]|nr:M48 family metalloprotease [Actinomycetota bacterium]